MEDMEKNETIECCGACKHMKCEDTDGFGYCFANEGSHPECYCGDKGCELFEEEKL